MTTANPILGFQGFSDAGRVPLCRETEFARILRIKDSLGKLHFLLKGARGVGKTTLLQGLAKEIAWTTGQIQAPILLNVSLTRLDTTGSVVTRLTHEIDRYILLLWDRLPREKSFLDKMKSVGTKYKRSGQAIVDQFTSGAYINGIFAIVATPFMKSKRADQSDIESVLQAEEFIEAFCRSVEHILVITKAIHAGLAGTKEGNSFQLPTGFVVVFDEADTIDPDRFSLATFIKLVHERLQASGDSSVSFIVAGLDDVDAKLLASHPSVLRMLEIVELEPFVRGPASKKFLDQLCAHSNIDPRIKLNESARELLDRLGEGIPFWILRTLYYAYEEEKKENPTASADKVSLNADYILRGYKTALNEVGRAACQSAISPKSSSDARKLLAWLAASGQVELEKGELLRIAGMEENEASLSALAELVSTEAVTSRRESAGVMIKFVTEGYQRWLNSELSAFEFVDSMPSLTQALHDLDSMITFAGEDVPAFNGVRKLFGGVMDSLGLPQRSRFVQFETFSHEWLFSTIEQSACVKEYRERLASEADPPRHNGPALRREQRWTLERLWEYADVLAIPSYLISEAYRLGAYDLGRLFADSPRAGEAEKSKAWRRYLESAAFGFSSSSVYNGAWIGLPFTLVPKVHYGTGSEHKSVIYEAKPGSLSLAYLWQKYVLDDVEHRPPIFCFDPELMDVVPDDRKGDWQNRIVKSAADFKKLVSANTQSLSTTWDFAASWREGEMKIVQTLEEHKAGSYYGWADWFIQFGALSDQARHAADKKITVEMSPPGNGDSSLIDGQFADAWVLVFPRRRSTIGRRNDDLARATARICMALMAPDWQSRFQDLTGVSPFRATLKSVDALLKFPWLRDLDLARLKLVFEGAPFDHYRIQAKGVTLSAIINAKDPAAEASVVQDLCTLHTPQPS